MSGFHPSCVGVLTPTMPMESGVYPSPELSVYSARTAHSEVRFSPFLKGIVESGLYPSLGRVFTLPELELGFSPFLFTETPLLR